MTCCRRQQCFRGQLTGQHRASMRSTTCSAASTGATTSSGSSTGRPSSRSTARSRARAPCSRRRPSSRSAAPSTRTASRASRSSTRPGVAQPGDLLREIHRLCHPRGHRLVLFESLNSMVRAWGLTRDARVLRPLLPDAARARGDRLLVDERARDAGVAAGHGQRGHAVRASRRRAQRARAQGRGARRQRPRLGAALARRGRPARALAARDRRPRGRLAARGAARARAQPARPRRPRGRDRERDLTGRARRARALAGDAGAAERGARGDDRRPGPRRGARQLPDRPPHRRPAARARSHAHAARRQPDLHIDLVHLDAREAAEPRPGRRAPPIVAVASGLVQVKIAGQTPRSGTARSWSPTASRSTAGATSARRKRCCSGSCSRASRTNGLRRSARRTPAGRSERGASPLGPWWYDRNRHTPTLAPEPRGHAEARAWRDARLRRRDDHRPRPRRSTTRSCTASPASPSIVMRSPSASR